MGLPIIRSTLLRSYVDFITGAYFSPMIFVWHPFKDKPVFTVLFLSAATPGITPVADFRFFCTAILRRKAALRFVFKKLLLCAELYSLQI